MKLHSNCLSGPKIKAFQKILPLMEEKFGKGSFHVDDAIRLINSNPDLEIRAYKGSTVDPKAKAFCDKTGHTSLNMQNACHCFAARKESRVVDKDDNGKTYQLLDQIEQMTYKIK